MSGPIWAIAELPADGVDPPRVNGEIGTLVRRLSEAAGCEGVGFVAAPCDRVVRDLQAYVPTAMVVEGQLIRASAEHRNWPAVPRLLPRRSDHRCWFYRPLRTVATSPGCSQPSSAGASSPMQARCSGRTAGRSSSRASSAADTSSGAVSTPTMASSPSGRARWPHNPPPPRAWRGRPPCRGGHASRPPWWWRLAVRRADLPRCSKRPGSSSPAVEVWAGRPASHS